MRRTSTRRFRNIRPGRRAAILLVLLLAAACVQLSVLALSGGAARLAMRAGDAGEAWNLQADRLVGRHDSEVLEAHGNVVLSHGTDFLKADFVRYFRNTNWVFLRGNVRAQISQDKLRAEEAEFDLGKQTGWLKRGMLYVSKPHLYFKGDYIRKHWGDTYSFKNAKVTACDYGPGKSPAWSLTAREGDITLDGYARLWSTSFNIKDQSVLKTPYLTVPVRTKRTSGLLFPETGYSSRHGLTLNVPVYWALDDESDVTLYEKFMSKRGLMQGAEYRVARPGGVKGMWRADWLHDQVVAKTEVDEESPLDEDGLVRANRERWWLRGKFNGRMDDWDVKADVDLVSDQNYLREFDKGMSGFSNSEDSFLKEFSRGLDAADQNRTSTVLVSRDLGRVGLFGRAQYTQNVGAGHGNTALSRDTSVQRLPEISAFVHQDRFGMGPVELSGEFAAAHLWRNYGSRGARFQLHPRFSLPVRTKYAAFIPTLGWRETLYATDTQDSGVDQASKRLGATGLPDIGFTAFTEAWKVFDVHEPFGSEGGMELSLDNLDKSRWTKLRHSVQPRISYRYVPTVDQSDKPYYDRGDRIEAENELTYSLTNILGRKREAVAARERKDGTVAPRLAVDYLDFVKLKLEQSYNLNEARRMDELGAYPRRPFSDVLAELTVALEERVDLFSRTSYSPYLSRITEHEHGLKVLWPGHASASVSLDFREAVDEYLRQDRDRTNILWLEANTTPLRSWTAGVRFGADMESGRDLEKQLILSYLHQCFDISLLMSQDAFEERFELLFSLTGLSFF